MSELLMIPRGKLKSSPLNNFKMDDIDRMAAMLKAAGLLSPLTVIGPFNDEGGIYKILSGHRRFLGMEQCAGEKDYEGQFDEVPCNVVSGSEMDDLNQRLRIQIANLESRDDTDKDEHRFELISIMKQMKDVGLTDDKTMLEDLEKYMQVSPRYARMYMAIQSNASEGTKQLLKDKKIAKDEAAALSYIPEAAQETAVDAILSGIPKKEVLGAVSEAKKNVREAMKERKENPPSDSPFKSDNSSKSTGSYGGGYTSSDIESIVDAYDSDTLEDNEYMEDEGGADDYINRVTNDEDFFRQEVEKALNDRKSDITRVTPGSVNMPRDDAPVETLEDRISKWVDRMLAKKKFTDEQLELIEKLRELVDYADELAY